MKYKIFFLLSVIFTFCFVSNSEGKPLKIHLGLWEVYRFEKVGGSLLNPQTVIGKKIEFDTNYIQCFEGILNIPKGTFRKVSYKWKDVDPDFDEQDGSRLALWNGPIEERTKGHVKMLIVTIGPNGDYFFELTKNEELAFYFDGNVFFFKKISSSNNSNKIRSDIK